MSYLRSKKRRLKDGKTQDYWYRVEGIREGGKVRQKVVEYLGTNPQTRTVPLDPALAARVALALIEGHPTAAQATERLRGLGLDLPGRPRQFSLTYTPPSDATLCVLNDPGPLRREPHQHACTPGCGRPLGVQRTVQRPHLLGADPRLRRNDPLRR